MVSFTIVVHIFIDFICQQLLLFISSPYGRKFAGCITLEELAMIIQSLEHSPSEKELQDMIDEAAAADGDGTIKFAKFLGLMANNIKVKTHEKMQEGKALNKWCTDDQDSRM